MNIFIKILLFSLLLVASNLFLFKSGYWFAQDTSYWPKNNYEAFIMLVQQLRVFTNFGYYSGFDQGLFNFTRIAVVSFVSLLEYVWGFATSQVIFTLCGYIITFISFYLFSGIFFKNKNIRFALSLLYTFNPLSYTLQGYVFFNSAIPLFLYSFYQFFYGSKKTRIIFLLLNIFSAFIWVSYIRFLQSNLFVILPFCLYFYYRNNKKISFTKVSLYVVSYILIFAPIHYSFINQLLERSQTAFNYGSILGRFVVKHEMINAFNLFQSIGVHLYGHQLWVVVGMLFFSAIIYLLITFPKNKYSFFLVLNFLLILLSIALFGLSNIFGDAVYLQLISFFPFIINEPFFALFILNVPLVLLLGLLTEYRQKYLYIFASLFLIVALLPFLNATDKQFKKYDIRSIPQPYKAYMVESFDGIAESTYYLLSPCWRARYMEEAGVETLCINFGLKYASAILTDPRLVSGDKYALSKLLTKTTEIDNLRVTHNLKNIIVPLDFTEKKDQPLVDRARLEFDANPLLTSQKNEYFIHYFYKDKNQYDFLLYSPSQIVQAKSVNVIRENNLNPEEKPIVINPSSFRGIDPIKSVNISYKLSPINPTKYYLHIQQNPAQQPFIIQLNQDYHPAWKIKWVDKEYFDSKKCFTGWRNFSITNNQYCEYASSLLDLSDITLLFRPHIDTNRHIQSNFIHNAWIVKEKNSKELYAVIINEKQIYYTIALLSFGITFISLLFIAIIQELLYRANKKL